VTRLHETLTAVTVIETDNTMVVTVG
jgi:hypothetical protein